MFRNRCSGPATVGFSSKVSLFRWARGCVWNRNKNLRGNQVILPPRRSKRVLAALGSKRLVAAELSNFGNGSGFFCENLVDLGSRGAENRVVGW